MAIARVWIEEGCIVCTSCQAECPAVFYVNDDTCVVIGSAREDGNTSENRQEKSPLKADLQQSQEAQIMAAIASCPVDVILFEKAVS